MAQHRSTVGRESEAHPAMLNEPETIAVARISQDLSEIFFKMMGKTPDPEAVQAEAEAFVAKYGPAAKLEDILA